MTDYQIRVRLKIFFLLIAALVVSFYSYMQTASFGWQQPLTLSFSLIAVLNVIYLYFNRNEFAYDPLSAILLGIYAAFALITLIHVQSAHWIYLVPLFGYTALPFRVAHYVVGTFIVMALIMVVRSIPSLEQFRVLVTFSVSAGLALVFAIRNEQKSIQMDFFRATDPLTQTFTRRKLEEDLTREIVRAEREGSQLSLILIQIDNFRAINEKSYEEGNQALRDLADAIKSSIRAYDNYYRFSGTGFAIIMPVTTAQEAEQYARNMKKRCQIQISLRGEPASISQGVASLDVGDNTQSLIEQAKNALSAPDSSGPVRAVNSLNSSEAH